MKAVSRFERDMLCILHAIVRHGPLDAAANLVRQRQNRPRCLSADAVALAKDTLAKGCVLHLARSGGWQAERFLRGEKPVMGRLWQRTPPEELGLVFSRNTLEFLLWLTSAGWEEIQFTENCAARAETVADQFFLVLAFEAFQNQDFSLYFRSLGMYRRLPLLWLLYPDTLARERMPTQMNWEAWTTGLGACVLEALQDKLLGRWLEMERHKGFLVDGQQLQEIGTAQQIVLGGFLAAVEEAGRWDLGRFLVRVLFQMLQPGTTAQTWVGSLRLKGLRLADRVEIYRAAMAVLGLVDHFLRWERRARTISYFDEGYHAAQFWLAEWERWNGNSLTERAHAIIREVEPLP